MILVLSGVWYLWFLIKKTYAYFLNLKVKKRKNSKKLKKKKKEHF